MFFLCSAVWVTADGRVKWLGPLAVTAPNHPPVVDAGSDRLGVTGLSVALDGSATDADGGTLLYHWTPEPGSPSVVVLSNDRVPDPSFTPTLAGTYRLRLTVTDDRGASASDTMGVIVSPPSGGGNDHGTTPWDPGPGDELVTRDQPEAGCTLSGTIATGREQDWFSLYAHRGNVYVVDWTGLGLAGTSSNHK